MFLSIMQAISNKH